MSWPTIEIYNKETYNFFLHCLYFDEFWIWNVISRVYKYVVIHAIVLYFMAS